MTGPGARVCVVVADDQRVVSEGLVTVLSVLPDVEVVGAAADGEQALALVDVLPSRSLPDRLTVLRPSATPTSTTLPTPAARPRADRQSR